MGFKGIFPKGLNDSLKKSFPSVVPLVKPEFVPSTSPLNGHWIAGFVTADGSFSLGVRNNPAVNSKRSLIINPIFLITQHDRDRALLFRIQTSLGAGLIQFRDNSSSVFRVSSISGNVSIIIPFFTKYPLAGNIALDFNYFVTGFKLIESGAHLTPSGINKLRELSLGMNTGMIY